MVEALVGDVDLEPQFEQNFANCGKDFHIRCKKWFRKGEQAKDGTSVGGKNRAEERRRMWEISWLALAPMAWAP